MKGAFQNLVKITQSQHQIELSRPWNDSESAGHPSRGNSFETIALELG